MYVRHDIRNSKYIEEKINTCCVHSFVCFGSHFDKTSLKNILRLAKLSKHTLVQYCSMGIKTKIFCAESVLLSTIQHRRIFHYAQRNASETIQMWYDRLERMAKVCLFGDTLKTFLLNKFIIDLNGQMRYPINEHRRQFHYAQRGSEETIQEWIIRLKCLAEPCKFQEHLEAFLFNKLVVDLGNAILTTSSGLKLNNLLEKMYKLDISELGMNDNDQLMDFDSASDQSCTTLGDNDIAIESAACASNTNGICKTVGIICDRRSSSNTFYCELCPGRSFKFKCKYIHI